MFNKITRKFNKVTRKFKKYVLKQFVQSNYLQETSVILPLTLLTFITKSIFNFLITSRLKTNYYIFDMIVSINTTIIFTLLSPFFYNLFIYTLNNEVNDFTKYIIKSFSTEGWTFYEYWKTRILGSLGIFAILLLFFVEINSNMIQIFILHTMISSSIVDYIYNYKPKSKLKELKESKEPKEEQPKTKVLSSMNMIESYCS